MAKHSTSSTSIAALRQILGMTLADMGMKIGLSKSQMHEVERTGRASLRVALALEQFSEGKLDASDLCEEVRTARTSAPLANRQNT